MAVIAIVFAACNEPEPGEVPRICYDSGTRVAEWKRWTRGHALAVATTGDGSLVFLGKATHDRPLNYGDATFTDGHVIAALDAEGRHLFSRSITLRPPIARAVDGPGWLRTLRVGPPSATDPQGVIVVGGYVPNGSTSFATEPLGSASALRLNREGEVLWSALLEDAAGTLSTNEVAADAAGNVVVVADFVPIPESFPNPPFAQGFVVAGFSAEGREVWRHRFGGDGNNLFARGLALDAAGTITVVLAWDGSTLPIDFGLGPVAPPASRTTLLVNFDQAGRTRWTKLVLEANTTIEAVVPAADGGIYVAGTQGRSNLGDVYRIDLVVARLDPSGELLWSRRFLPAAQQDGSLLARDPCGAIVVTANTRDGLAGDQLFLRLDQAGNVTEERLLGQGRSGGVYGLAAWRNQAFLLGGTGDAAAGEAVVTRLSR
ncbi:MAG TPA: hypothetical protein VGG33_19500 [Polyangia bacterium]